MAAANVTTAADLNSYAHSQTVADDRFADYATNKANNLRRLTYGFAQIGDKTKPAVVPKSAEVLLETRLPYLSAEQRRVVLKTTALPSGYPALDDAEGWGRLNLFAAADGYGAFNGDVSVTMDASLGGFSLLDVWRNDIGGAGRPQQGRHGHPGPERRQQLQRRHHRRCRRPARGLGQRLGQGRCLCQRRQPDQQRQHRAELGRGLHPVGRQHDPAAQLGSGGAGRLNVAGKIALGGGVLRIAFSNGYKPVVGDTLTVLSGGSLQGKFDSIVVDGYTATPTYSGTALTLRIGG